MENKVLLILVDGMRPDGLLACGDTGIEDWFKEGAYSFKAQSVLPPVTLPCHMSLFHSVDPERHGVTTNVFVPQNHPIRGLFDVLTMRGKKTAIFYIWEQLRDLWRPGGIHYAWYKSWDNTPWTDLDRQATDACKTYIEKEDPDFVFLYLGETDEYGHRYGWMSQEYLDCIRRACECIRDISEMVSDRYHIIVTADHGGHGRNHGENVPEDMTIPMCFKGPAFEKGREIKNLSLKDIAPTVMELFGFPPEADWEGQSVIH